VVFGKRGYSVGSKKGNLKQAQAAGTPRLSTDRTDKVDKRGCMPGFLLVLFTNRDIRLLVKKTNSQRRRDLPAAGRKPVAFHMQSVYKQPAVLGFNARIPRLAMR